jgi:hypothetical protein
MADEPRRGWWGQPKPRPGPRMPPGGSLAKLKQLNPEKIEAAIARAEKEDWWPWIVERRPRWSCGFWVWTLKPGAPVWGKP